MLSRELERKGRFKLTIWPDHCLIGTRGHAVVPELNKALQEWATYSERPIVYVSKGQNCRTEMYSALSSEVGDPTDFSTDFNSELMSMLRVSERVCLCIFYYLYHFIPTSHYIILQLIVCGQALSHCVNYTLDDIMRHWQGDLSKIVLLEDGSNTLLPILILYI